MDRIQRLLDKYCQLAFKFSAVFITVEASDRAMMPFYPNLYFDPLPVCEVFLRISLLASWSKSWNIPLRIFSSQNVYFLPPLLASKNIFLGKFSSQKYFPLRIFFPSAPATWLKLLRAGETDSCQPSLVPLLGGDKKLVTNTFQ